MNNLSVKRPSNGIAK